MREKERKTTHQRYNDKNLHEKYKIKETEVKEII